MIQTHGTVRLDVVALRGCMGKPVAAPSPKQADERPDLLRGSSILESPREEVFQRLARLVATVLGAPISMITLVSEDRQFFKAAHGLPSCVADLRWTPLSQSICNHVVRGDAPFRVRDVREDALIEDTRFIAASGIASYAGVPLRAVDGHVLGALCVIDIIPRDWSDAEILLLEELAESTMAMIHLKVEVARRAEAERVAVERQGQLDRTLKAANGIGLWSWDLATGRIVLDENLAQVMGVDPSECASGLSVRQFGALIHPDDRLGVAIKGREACLGGVPFASEYRVRGHGRATVWLQASGESYADAQGIPFRLSGIAIDVTAQRAALERQEGISGELAHRVKNMMATVQAVVMQTLREAGSIKEASHAVEERLNALSRAHDLLVVRGWDGAEMREVASNVAATFGKGRFEISGPALRLSPRATLALSMAFHELATNAVKYGALSNAQGKVYLGWSEETVEGFRVEWRESDGPVVFLPSRKGFGSRLLQRVVATDLNGSVEADYVPSGLDCRIYAGRP